LLSSFAVDLSVSNQLRHPEIASAVVACDDRDKVSNPSGSSEIVDKSGSGCSRPTEVVTPASVAVVTETFLRPMSHSTPIQDFPCYLNCGGSFSTSDDSDNESEDDDHPVNRFFLFIIFCAPHPIQPRNYTSCALYINIIYFQSRFVNDKYDKYE
jgi:hypothetical protein